MKNESVARGPEKKAVPETLMHAVGHESWNWAIAIINAQHVNAREFRASWAIKRFEPSPNVEFNIPNILFHS